MWTRVAQLGIAVGVLGLVIALIGLFPSVTGLEPSPGIGVVQTLVILAGFGILILGAYIYVQATYYPGVKHNLAQQIGVRLSMTGMVIAVGAGMADILGIGSNSPGPGERPVLGALQAAGLIGGFIIASAGLVLFALKGDSKGDDGNDGSE